MCSVSHCRKNSETILELNGRFRILFLNSQPLKERLLENLKEPFLSPWIPPVPRILLLLAVWRWDKILKSHDGSLWDNARWSIMTLFEITGPGSKRWQFLCCAEHHSHSDTFWYTFYSFHKYHEPHFSLVAQVSGKSSHNYSFWVFFYIEAELFFCFRNVYALVLRDDYSLPKHLWKWLNIVLLHFKYTFQLGVSLFLFLWNCTSTV